MRCINCELEETTMILIVLAATIFWCPKCGALFTKGPSWSYWRTPSGERNGDNRGTRKGLQGSAK
jgi:hypothetical protein